MAKLTEILEHKRRLLSTEFLPPKTPNLNELVAKTLKVADVVDSVNVPELKANDHAVPKHRMNPFYTALRLRDLTGVETAFHLTPRDYNRNAIAGILLAASEARMLNILVVGGDKYSVDEAKKLSKNVYDFPGCGALIRGIRQFESEASLGSSSRFCIIVGADPTVIYSRSKEKLEDEISKLLDRQDVGADLVQTQPVFDDQVFEFLQLAREQGLKLPVLVGVVPLRGRIDSDEIQRRYGIAIPDEIKSKLKDFDEEAGMEMCRELALRLVKNGVEGLHVYPRENGDFLLGFRGIQIGRVSTNLNQN